MNYLGVLAVGMCILTACTPDARVDYQALVDIPQPDSFPERAPWSVNVHPKVGTVALGQKLFSDRSLSSDGTVSCGNCHRQEVAFSDAPEKRSTGVNGRTGGRNTPPVQNLAWMPSFMWDGGINHLEVMPIAPFVNEVEHNISLKEVVRSVRRSDYRRDFKRAFGDTSITAPRIIVALAHFMMTKVSSQAPIDSFYRRERLLSNAERTGRVLFNEQCGSCHSGALLSDFTYKSHPGSRVGSDVGRFLVSQVPSDSFQFKTPSLRNWKYTAPYGHAGQWATLEEVLQDWHTQGEYLTADEKASLLQFLSLFNDSEFITL